jgi:hypothetical protein
MTNLNFASDNASNYNFQAFNSDRTLWMQGYANSESQAMQIVANDFELTGDQLNDIQVVFD